MNNKYKKLILSIIFDGIGMATLLPFDIIWAPLSGYLMTRMYAGNLGKVAGIVSFLEEIIPFSNMIPTFTLIWIYNYVIKKIKIRKLKLLLK